VTFEELRDAGPAAPLAAMEALPVRADNGLYEMACRLLAVEPGLRPSAVGCLTGLTPVRRARRCWRSRTRWRIGSHLLTTL
jgi:hypothetical protein